MPENLNENNNPQNKNVDFERIIAKELENTQTLNDIISETEVAAKYIANPPVVNENNPDQLNPEAKIREKLEDELRNIPMRNTNHYNVVLIGDTGAGKSTLINALFGRKVAQTFDGGQPGLNAPIIQNVFTMHNDTNIGHNDSKKVFVTKYEGQLGGRAILYHANRNCNISVWDTQGLEQGNPEIMVDTVDLITKNAIRQNNADNFIDAVCMVQDIHDIRFYGTKKNAILKLNQAYKNANGNGCLPIFFINTKADTLSDRVLIPSKADSKQRAMVKLHYLAEANKLNAEQVDILYTINTLDSTHFEFLDSKHPLDEIRSLIDDEDRILTQPELDDINRNAAIRRKADYEKILDLKTRFPDEDLNRIINISCFDIGGLETLPQEIRDALSTNADKYNILTGCSDSIPDFNLPAERMGIDELTRKIALNAAEVRKAAYVRHIQENLKAHFKRVTDNAFKNAEMFRWHINDVSKYFNELPYMNQNSVNTFISKIVHDGMSFSLRQFSKDIAEQPIDASLSAGKYIEKSLLDLGNDLSNCCNKCIRESVSRDELEKEIHRELSRRLIENEKRPIKLGEKRVMQLEDRAEKIRRQQLIDWYTEQTGHSKGEFIASSIFSFGIMTAIQKKNQNRQVNSILADSNKLKALITFDIEHNPIINIDVVDKLFANVPEYIEDKVVGMLRRGEPEAIEIADSIEKEALKTALEQNGRNISGACKNNILNNWLVEMQTNYNTVIKNTIDERIADKVDTLTQDIHRNIDQKISGQLSM